MSAAYGFNVPEKSFDGRTSVSQPEQMKHEVERAKQQPTWPGHLRLGDPLNKHNLHCDHNVCRLFPSVTTHNRLVPYLQCLNYGVSIVIYGPDSHASAVGAGQLQQRSLPRPLLAEDQWLFNPLTLPHAACQPCSLALIYWGPLDTSHKTISSRPVLFNHTCLYTQPFNHCLLINRLSELTQLLRLDLWPNKPVNWYITQQKIIGMVWTLHSDEEGFASICWSI